MAAARPDGRDDGAGRSVRLVRLQILQRLATHMYAPAAAAATTTTTTTTPPATAYVTHAHTKPLYRFGTASGGTRRLQDSALQLHADAANVPMWLLQGPAPLATA